MKGYKVFNPDWTCLGFQYKVGKTYKIIGMPICCNVGFHFCKDLKDCFSYYDFDPDNKVAVVEALGNIDTLGNKSCTNKIKIVEEVSWADVLRLVNTGKGCSGLRNNGSLNSGDCNSGYRNSGDCNSGDCNSGYWNNGNCNSGYRNSGGGNSGNCNSGYWNSGDRNNGSWNSGDWNSGDCNSGDWNKTSFSSGVFNTEEEKIRMFNRPSNWTYRDWRESDACRLLRRINRIVAIWIYPEDMTDAEKKQHPEYVTTGGYLKVLDESECAQEWWDSLSEQDREIIYSLPNFDVEIFEEITGIKIKK